MTQYRRAFIAGDTWFFTVNLAHRRSVLLTERIKVDADGDFGERL